MKLLVIGGTRFLGRAIVDAAYDAGHELTLFNRGQTNPDLYPDLDLIRGDRDGDLNLLEGRTWDAVIDTCGYVPRLVGAAAEQLSAAVEHYTYISSISVYADPVAAGTDEDAPLATMGDEAAEEVTGETYGPLKALCERAADQAMNGPVLHVRAGLIVGPHDPTDRFTYWPHRLARGGRLLAPGRPDAPVQFIDVRDIASWIVSAAAANLTGPYNVTGPAAALTFDQFLQECTIVSGTDSTIKWIGESFLLEHDVRPFTDLPLWVPQSDAGIMQINCEKALGDGLSLRPLSETIGDTLDWANTRSADYQWQNGLAPQREADLLHEWFNRHK